LSVRLNPVTLIVNRFIIPKSARQSQNNNLSNTSAGQLDCSTAQVQRFDNRTILNK
jgi:hypothetical protein